MKTWVIVILAVAAGVVAGTGASVWRLGFPGSGNPLDPSELVVSAGPLLEPPAEGAAGKLVVALRKDGKLYEGVTNVDFGVLPEAYQDGAEFVFQNKGDGPLQILHRRQDSNCKCTVADFGQGHNLCKTKSDPSASDPEDVAAVIRKTIPPGDELVVRLCWRTENAGEPFRNHATVHTNDPDPSKRRVELSVHGKVTQALTVDPMVNFGDVHNQATVSKPLHCTVYHTDELQIKDAKVVDAKFAQHLEVTSTRMLAKDELADPHARAGYQLTLTLKPGMPKPGLPLGRFETRIRLATDAAADQEVQVRGVIVGDISVARSRGWLPVPRVFDLAQVDGSEGKTRTIFLEIRGPQRNKIQIQGVKTTPTALRATVGTPTKSENLVRWPVTIEIPAGTPAMNYAERGRYAKLILETNHPDDKQITLNVSFEVH